MHVAYKIVLVTVISCVAAITYGIVNDTITTGMAMKYFTDRNCHPGHYRMLLNSPFVDKGQFTTENPAPDDLSDDLSDAKIVPRWKVVLFFGVVATWREGLALGLVLCIPAFVGKWPHIPLKTLLVGISLFIPITLFISFVVAHVDNFITLLGASAQSPWGIIVKNCGGQGYTVGVMHNTGYIMSVVYVLFFSVFIIVRRHRLWTHGNM